MKTFLDDAEIKNEVLSRITLRIILHGNQFSILL